MFKFIHAADIHLDSPLRGLERYEGAPVDAIRQATRRALENLVQLALQNQVAFVLLAGDLYDGDWKEFRTGLFFVSQMVKLREARIPVYLVAGNHDAANKMTRRLPLPENVQMFPPDEPKTLILPDYDVAIHGQSFARASVLENLSQNYPAADRGLFNIGLLHTAATGREGHEPYAPCTVEGLRAKGYDYWALGHVHKQEVLYDDPPILFSGNIQGRHIRETGPKGCVLVTVDDRHATHFQWQWLDVFRWEYCRVDAAEAATGDDLLDRVRQRLAELVTAADGRSLAARVEVTGACGAHRALVAEPNRWTNEIRALAQDVGGGELWIEKVQLRTALAADASGQSPDGPIGELIQRIAELKSDPEDLGRLGGEFADLLEKLPPELKEGVDALGLERPETLRDMLDQVEQLLIHQLLACEGSP
jgi:DNA repair exonuclease SbcCD nuclease subunit